VLSSDLAGAARVRRALLNLLTVAAATAVYFALPLGVFGVSATWAFVAAFAVGVLLVSVVLARQVRRYRSGGTAVTGVLVALCLAVLFFAAVYFGLAAHRPGEVAQLRTKVDALYFALSITSTVGFGDVHAAGQLARAVVAVHIGFNLLFLGVAVRAISEAR